MLSKWCFALFFFLGIIIFSNSCEVQNCPCSYNSPISGKWSGIYISENVKIELNLNLIGTSTDINGNANLIYISHNINKEELFTVSGSYRANRLILNSFEKMDFKLEGYYNTTKDSLFADLFYEGTSYPFLLQKQK